MLGQILRNNTIHNSCVLLVIDLTRSKTEIFKDFDEDDDNDGDEDNDDQDCECSFDKSEIPRQR
ncbi:hypothetical protein DPMN_069040 [Dreissena polymorpha]|uniref:Uncharacterized protein n=1 Tax=Dreissena polymorpha TaxID=45954 RepID=A0A9D4BMQ6_DREPO|nr:hypothetical protein DPMN_069040 [Dreissena polymorpha]